MAILITGGTGFLGRHPNPHLLQHGERVVIFDAVPTRERWPRWPIRSSSSRAT